MTSSLPPVPPQTVETQTPLWQFATRLWQEPAASQAALSLQGMGWVVSHLLVAAWLAREGYLWDGREPADIQRWRKAYTETLRVLRTDLPKTRGDLSALRKELAQAELEAERIELGLWFQWLQAHPLPRTPAHTPSRLLAENLIATADDASTQSLALLAIFAQALIPSEDRASFELELRGALDQADLQP